MKKNTPVFLVAIGLFALVSCSKEMLQQPGRKQSPTPASPGTILNVVQPEISKKVKIANPTGGDSLLAWLFVPATSVDVPAVVVLHGSGGLWKENTNPSHSIMSSQFTKWVDVFRTEKIAALFIDSYVSRGIPDDFADVAPPSNFHVAAEFVRPRDAYSGLAFMRSQNKIKDNKIGLLGFSHGGTSAVSAMVDSVFVDKASWRMYNSTTKINYYIADGVKKPAGKPAEGGFVAAVSYYPGLGFYSYYGSPGTPSSDKYRSYAPIMIHAAEKDALYTSTADNNDANPVVKKRIYDAFKEKAILNGCSLANGNALTMHVYTNANHSFDGKTGDANATQADKDADAFAKTRTLNFLKPFLGL